ncbi:hypothetical protein AMAG_19331 [Allomyces macrogynus ATCC 38327]|uniref:Uncharacterized protein n=1 Tax=Allomyces macrogynus (strain ATCC 38327) TaxID=578462 RepID=A0A0L0SU34_ALLM3|nr:hypothetical protein AMAG_19331 [Allomyces macrogynus ATCC 38327]|eukprot:KNE66068.1 hypothetical protein AMAG_19331 [Allomyces macrogynus ATCC 38327]
MEGAPHNGTRASLWTHYHKWEVEQRVELVKAWLGLPATASADAATTDYDDGTTRFPSPTHPGRVNRTLVPTVDTDDVGGIPGAKSADMPLVRPDLIALYIPDVDQVGHQYGPDSIQLNQTLVRVDRALASLAAFLYARDLWETTNDRVAIHDRWPVLLLEPNDPAELHHILARLRATEIKYHYRTYLKHEVPEHLHYRDNPRIPPIVAIPESGYQFEAWPNESLPQGMHGRWARRLTLVILEDAHASYRDEIVVELSSNSIEDMESNVERIKEWAEEWVEARKKMLA